MASGPSRSSSKSHKPYDANRRHHKPRRSLALDRPAHTSSNSTNGGVNGNAHRHRAASTTSSFSYVDHAMASSSRNGAGNLSMASANDDDDEEEGAIAESDADDEEGAIDAEQTGRDQGATSINGPANHASSSSSKLLSRTNEEQHHPLSPAPPRPPLGHDGNDLHRRLSDRVVSLLKASTSSSEAAARSDKESSRNATPTSNLNNSRDTATQRRLSDRISVSRAFDDEEEPSGPPARQNGASSSQLSPPPPAKHRSSSSRASPLPPAGQPSSLPAKPPSPLPPPPSRSNSIARPSDSERERRPQPSWRISDQHRSPSPPPTASERHRSSSNHWRNRELLPPPGDERRRRDHDGRRHRDDYDDDGRRHRDDYNDDDDDDRDHRRGSWSRSDRRSDREPRRSDRERDRGDEARSNSRRSRREDRGRSRSRSRSGSRSRSTERRRDDDRRERRYSRREEDRYERHRRRSPSADGRQHGELGAGGPGAVVASSSSRRGQSEQRRAGMDLDEASRVEVKEQQQEHEQEPPQPRLPSQTTAGPSASSMPVDDSPAQSAASAGEGFTMPAKPSTASTASVTGSDGSVSSVNGTPQSPWTTPASTSSASTSGTVTGWKKVGVVAPSNAPPPTPSTSLVGVPTGPRSMKVGASAARSATSTPASPAAPLVHHGAIPTGPRALQFGRKAPQHQQHHQSHTLPSPHFLSSPIGATHTSSPSTPSQPTSFSQPSSFAPVEPAAPPPAEAKAPPPPPPPGPPPGPPPVRPDPVELPVPPPLSFGHTLLPTELPIEQRKKGWRLSHDPELDGSKSKGKKPSRKPADVESAVSDPRRHKTTTMARLAQSHRKRAKELNTVVWAWDKHSTGPRPPPPPCEIVVTGLSPLTTNRQLLDRFRLLGRIDKAELKMNPQTGQSMGIFWLRYAHDFDEDGARLESASSSGPGQKGNDCAAEAVKLANGERLGATDKMMVQFDQQQAKYIETFKTEMNKSVPAPKAQAAVSVEVAKASASAFAAPPAAAASSAHKPSAAPTSTPLHHLSKSSPLAAAAIARSPSSSVSNPVADAYRRRGAPIPSSSSSSSRNFAHDEDAEADSGEEFGNRHRLLAFSSSRRGGFNNVHGSGRGGGGSGGAGFTRSRMTSGDGMHLSGPSSGGVSQSDVDAASRDILEPTWKILSRLSILGTPYIFVSRSTVGDGLTSSLVQRHFAIFSPQNVSADEAGWYVAFSGHDAAARCDKVLGGKPIHGFSVSFEVRQAPTKEEIRLAKAAANAPSLMVAPGSSPQKAKARTGASSDVDDHLAQRQPPSWLDPASALEWHRRQTYADRKATRGWTEKELVEEARSTILRELAEGFLKDLKTRVVVPHVSDFLKEDAPGGIALKKAAEEHAAATAAAAKAAATAASTPSHGGDAAGKTEEPATTLPSFRKLRRASPSPPPPARRPSATTKTKPRKSAARKGGRVISDDDDEDEGEGQERESARSASRRHSQAAEQPRRQDMDRTYGSSSSGEEDESDDEGHKDNVRPPPPAGSVRDATEETAETAETALTTPTPEPTPASANAAAATSAASKKGSKAGKKAAAKAAAAAKKKQAASKKAAAAAAAAAASKEEEHVTEPSPSEDQPAAEDVVMEDTKEQSEEADAAMAKLIAAAAAAPPSRKSKSAKMGKPSKASPAAAPARPRSPSPDPFAVGVAEEEEDLYFLKVALERLCAGESVTPETLPEEIDGEEDGGARLNEDGEYEGVVDDGGINFTAAHSSGSARTEGFYKIPPAQKAAHLPDRNKAIADTTTNVTLASARGNRADSRRVLLGLEQHHKSSLESNDADASTAAVENHSDMLLKFNQLRSRKKQLKFAKSPIHDWGLYAMETIPAGDMVIEYVGEQVRQQVADHRERLYEKSGNFSTYLFRVDDDVVVDATHKGNIARLMNHCCVPNCNARILTLNGQKRIVLYAKTTILPGQELTYDYKFQATPDADDAIACLCGAEGCRRFL